MNKLAAAIVTCLSLGLVSGVSAADGASAPDLSISATEAYFSITAGGVSTGDINIAQNTRYNPVLVPCDATWISAYLHVDYNGDGPTVYPGMSTTYYNEDGSLLALHGFDGRSLPNPMLGWMWGLDPDASTGVGWYMFDATDMWRHLVAQPGDLPEGELVRIRFALTDYADSAYSTLLVDATPADNARDFWFKRECACQ
jgi:hypothetical protein